MENEDPDRNYVYRHRIMIFTSIIALTFAATTFVLLRQNVRLHDVYIIELEILDNLESIENTI